MTPRSPRNIAFPAGLRGAEATPPGLVPCVVIVGRPNVGKSSLLNCIARKRIAIVDPTPGVTRDRIAVMIEHEGRFFELWDTGGIGTQDDLAEEVESQIETALARADLVLFVVDAQEGLTLLDEEIARQLRRINRKTLLVANKTDHAKHESSAAEFHRLGFGAPIPLCALHGHGRADLLDALTALLPESHVLPQDPVMKLAFAGRQNVGKSTLANTLAREERVIVSELPGTTRDAVDVRIERDGKAFLVIDTAGLKRRSRMQDSVQFYSADRALRAIRRADVVLLMVDVTAEISMVDKQLAGIIDREFKPCIITVNKWDLARDRITTDAYLKYLNDHLPALAFAPVSFISAQDRENVDKTLSLAEALFAQSRREISTSDVNQTLRAAVEMTSPPVSHGKRPNLLYGTQVAVAPPTFLIFASHPEAISDQYLRYLQNFFRSHLPIPEVPIRFLFRGRDREKGAKDTAE